MRNSIYFLMFFLPLIFSCNKDVDVTNDLDPNEFKFGGRETMVLQNYNDSIFYSLGVVVGQNIKRYGFEEVDLNAFTSGLIAALNNQNIEISPEIAKRILSVYLNKRLFNRYIDEQKRNAEFLKLNALREGVIITNSGLQYEIIRRGSGKQPSLNDYVIVHYRGVLLDSTEIGNTFGKHPVKFLVKNSLKGWQEALTMMHEGDIWKIYLPPDLAFGKKGGKIVKPNSVVIYKIQLLKVVEK